MHQIGAGAHASYNPNSPAALLSVAILNSISAGILLWAGIVELLVHDFLHVRPPSPFFFPCLPTSRG